MSKISLTPNASGTGTFTIESPNSNTNRTLTLPDSDGEIVTTSTLPEGTPAGTVVYSAGNTPPTGFLKANGASVSTTTYAALFAVIGYTYGGSGGSFSLPDLRGEFLRGWDDSRGVDSGRSFGSAQLDQMQRITGQVTTGAERWNLGSYTGALSNYSTSGSRNTGGDSNNVMGIAFDSASSPNARVSSTTAGETRPRNIALLACIKY